MLNSHSAYFCPAWRDTRNCLQAYGGRSGQTLSQHIVRGGFIAIPSHQFILLVVSWLTGICRNKENGVAIESYTPDWVYHLEEKRECCPIRTIGVEAKRHWEW